MKRKSNIITTLALILAILTIALLPLPVAQAANFTVSKSNVSIENGKSSTITINAPTHTGRVDIVSSNTGVATASESNLWVENNSKTITISAKSPGTATITIKGELYDASTEEESTFSKTVNVTVTKAASSGSTNTSGNSGGTQTGTSSGSTSNNNQNLNSGTSSSGGQSSSTTSKPNSSGSSNSSSSKPSTSNSSTSKPSNNSSTSSSQNVQNNTSVGTPAISEQEATVESNNEEISIEETEEIVQEEVNEETLQQNTNEEEQKNAEINNVEEVKSHNTNGKIIIIVIIGAIALILMFIGIGMSKNILKK